MPARTASATGLGGPEKRRHVAEPDAAVKPPQWSEPLWFVNSLVEIMHDNTESDRIRALLRISFPLAVRTGENDNTIPLGLGC